MRECCNCWDTVFPSLSALLLNRTSPRPLLGQVIGVEPCGANAMAMSLAKGARVTLSRVDGFADGVAVKCVSGHCYVVRPPQAGQCVVSVTGGVVTGGVVGTAGGAQIVGAGPPVPAPSRVQVGAETFRMCRQLVDGVVLVDNAAISGAIKDVFNETRSILEPAGAVAVRAPGQGKRVGDLLPCLRPLQMDILCCFRGDRL